MNLRPDTFINFEGAEEPTPEPGTPFPIGCGPWPNEHAHARQMSCDCCKARVGISPKGYALHMELPQLRPILCMGCLALLNLEMLRLEKEQAHGRN